MKTKSSEERTEHVNVTPALAAKWLCKNRRNRPLRSTRVDLYAREMAAGRWHFTGEPIQFGADGDLYDGQHRLAAVVKSGATVRLAVTRGLAPEARYAIDKGDPRTAADTLALIHGGEQWQRRVAVLRMIDLLVEDTPVKRSDEEIHEMYGVYGTGVDWALGLAGRGLAYAPVTAALAFAYPTDPERVAEFAARAQSGDGHARGSPALAFREGVLLRNRSGANGGVIRKEIARKTLRAIMAHIKGDVVSKLHESDKSFAFFAKFYAPSGR